MNDDNYVSPHRISKQFNIISGTLRMWAEEGKIKYLRPNGTGRRIYNVNDVRRIFGITESEFEKKETICYTRVSSNHQKDDLKRQIENQKE